MIRQLIRLVIFMTLVLSLLMAASAVIGRGIDTPVAVALVYPEGSRGSIHPTGEVALFDLHRLLRANKPVPLTDLSNLAFDFRSTDGVFVSTYYGNSNQPRYQAGLYYYNFMTGDLTTIYDIESSQSLKINESFFYIFRPTMSPDGQKLIFTHPTEKQPYLFDFTTQQTSRFVDLNIITTMPTGYTEWSPDGTRVAIKDARTLYLYNADGSLQFEYESDDSSYFPSWVDDGRYLWIQRPSGQNSRNQPIEIISTTDGSPYPFTEQLEGQLESWWGCDNQWLAYSVATEGAREGYLLNVRTGETIRVKDAPLLAEESIIGLSPVSSTTCSKFIVYANRPDSAGPDFSRREALYLFDPVSRSAEWVDDMASIISLTDEALYYEKVDPATNVHQIFKRTIEPLSEAERVRQYQPVQASWLNWSEDLSVAVYSGITSSNYLTGALYRLDGNTGQAHQLTTDQEYVEGHALFEWSALQAGGTQ